MFPQWPCLRANAERVLDALLSQEIPYGRDGRTVPMGEQVAQHRLTIRHADLKEWMQKRYPDQKPAFLFDGLWTKPISLGGRSAGWPASEVIALNAARIAGKLDTEVRELVRSLESDRKKVLIGKDVNLLIRLVLLASVLVKSLVVLAS